MVVKKYIRQIEGCISKFHISKISIIPLIFPSYSSSSHFFQVSATKPICLSRKIARYRPLQRRRSEKNACKSKPTFPNSSESDPYWISISRVRVFVLSAHPSLTQCFFSSSVESAEDFYVFILCWINWGFLGLGFSSFLHLLWYLNQIGISRVRVFLLFAHSSFASEKSLNQCWIRWGDCWRWSPRAHLDIWSGPQSWWLESSCLLDTWCSVPSGSHHLPPMPNRRRSAAFLLVISHLFRFIYKRFLNCPRLNSMVLM